MAKVTNSAAHPIYVVPNNCPGTNGQMQIIPPGLSVFPDEMFKHLLGDGPNNEGCKVIQGLVDRGTLSVEYGEDRPPAPTQTIGIRVDDALDLIKKTSDVDKLEAWFGDETKGEKQRTRVVKALQSRLKALL